MKTIIPFLCIVFLSGTSFINKEPQGSQPRQSAPETGIIPVQSKNSGITENPFFFNRNISRVKYNGSYIGTDIIEQPFFLNIKHLKDFPGGTLYVLYLDKLKVNDQWDQIPEGRETLGYFYVTKDQIYKFSEYKPVTEKENQSIINSITKNEKEFIGKCQLVCQDKATKAVPDKDGYYQYIEAAGDKRTFRHYNDGGGTTWYERMEWKKGKGLVLYRSGFGAGREEIFFGS